MSREPGQTQETLYDYDAAGNVQYVGKHLSPGAKMSDPGWRVVKYIWDASGNLEQKSGPAIGAWDDRNSLF